MALLGIEHRGDGADEPAPLGGDPHGADAIQLTELHQAIGRQSLQVGPLSGEALQLQARLEMAHHLLNQLTASSTTGSCTSRPRSTGSCPASIAALQALRSRWFCENRWLNWLMAVGPTPRSSSSPPVVYP